MRIGFVTQWFPPENVWVPSSILDGLRAEGHEVVVLTGTPHYPTGKVTPGYSPTEWRTERIHDVLVHRVPEFPYRGSDMVGRLAGYASFALTSSAQALRVMRDCDVVLVYSSPATAALPAMLLRLAAGVPYVLQAQDIWPDSVVDSGFVQPSARLRFIAGALRAFVSASYAGSSKVVGITPSAVELLGNRSGARGKVELVYNWSPEPATTSPYEGPDLRQMIGAQAGARVFLYAGAMGKPQNLAAVLQGFVDADIDAHLVLMGPGTERNDLLESSAPHPRVHVLPAVPLDEATALTREADVAIVSLADTPLHRATFPSKVQFLCALGKPLLVAAPGDAAHYVEAHQAGLSASPSDAASIALAFRRFAGMEPVDLTLLGDAARDAYEVDFSPRVGSRRLANILERAASSRKRSTDR